PVPRGRAPKPSWGVFHTPKNLSMALAGEAGELLAEFQWLTPEESDMSALTSEKHIAIQMEIADVMIYLLRLCDVLQINLREVVEKKLAINDCRFPPGNFGC
ncbi:MAG: nucleotide pyrophosphohydrolase, partial [Acidimicrobiales bacterium]